MIQIAPAAPAQPAQAGAARDPLASLTSNMNDFLKMLMTQLRNQDPTTPMDTNQFTSQLVQFASVEQQVNINTGVQSLLQLTQANNVLQASGLIGKNVTATSPRIALVNGTGGLAFNTPAAEPVTISVLGANGMTIAQASLTSAAGSNSWSWDGTDAQGKKMPDGAYTVAVSGGPAGVTPTPIPFTVSGLATGVAVQNNVENVRIGPLTLPVSAIQSVGN